MVTARLCRGWTIMVVLLKTRLPSGRYQEKDGNERRIAKKNIEKEILSSQAKSIQYSNLKDENKVTCHFRRKIKMNKSART